MKSGFGIEGLLLDNRASTRGERRTFFRDIFVFCTINQYNFSSRKTITSPKPRQFVLQMTPFSIIEGNNQLDRIVKPKVM